MATLKITQVVETTKEIEIEYPLYLKSKHGEYTMIVNEHNGYRVIPAINCMIRSTETAELILSSGGSISTKAEFNEAVQKADANFTLIYEAIQGAQANAIHKDECDQRADLEDAKTQEQLENYLGK